MAIMAPLRYVPIGFGYVICANCVWMISRNGSAAASRVIKEAKKNKMYIDCTFSRATKSLLFLDNGHVIGCTFSPDIMLKRFRNATAETIVSDDVDDEGADE